jgi:hypothetical protein
VRPQEEYVKDEMKNLKREIIRAKEVRFFREPHFPFVALLQFV